jgi:putative cell wall-binding protein
MVTLTPRGHPLRLVRLALASIMSLSLLGGSGTFTPTVAAAPQMLTVAQVNKGLTGEVYGFLPYWEIDTGVDAYLRYDLLTTVALFSVYIDGTSGALSSSTLLGSGRAALISTIVQHAHAAGVRVDLTVRPSPDTATANQAFLANATAQAAAVTNIASTVAQLGLDGANLDFESLYNADFAGYASWAAALRTRLRQADVAARVTVSTNANVSGSGIARKVTDAGVDRVFIMGYAYRSSGSSPVGVISPYDRYTGNASDLDLLWTLGQYDKVGVPRNRLLLGLPYYGMRWPTVTGALHSLRASGGGVTWLPSSGLPAGANVQRDTVEQAAWFALQDPTTKAWTQTYYDDGTSLRAKYGLAVSRGLAGVGMWALGYDRGVSGYWEAIAATFGVLRVAGSDRYGTAQAVSANLLQPGVPTVIIASGETFADALGGSAAAGRLGTSLLLTSRSSLPAATTTELKRLGPTHVLVLGGSGTISDAVLAKIQAAVPGATVTRISGSDRYATAAALSLTAFPAGAPVAFVASGASFPDGLAGGAAAARLGGPLLLSAPDKLPDATRDELARLAPTQVYVLGGTSSLKQAVADAVATTLPGAAVSRLAGANRYATAVAVAGLQGPGVPVVYLASGTNFPDGLSGGAAAGQLGGPLLLTVGSGLPSVTANELARLKPRRVVILGGAAVISNTVVAQVRSYLALP